jgi:hypothetical protein
MTGAWNPTKVSVFRESFYEFLRYVTISSRDKGQMVLGDNLYRAQVMFYDTIFDGLGEDVHEFYVLKSRQLGMSTSTRALSVFWLGMHEGLRGAMVFDTAFNTASARREIEETIDNLPSRMKFPKIRARNRDHLILDNDSWLMFMQAGTRNSRAGGGLGRSLGLNFVHASEISSWANEEGVTSFRQSLTEEYPDRLYIWESTARGYELWYKLWEAAKQDELGKRTLFIGWWAKDNQKYDRDSPEFSIYGTEPPNQKEIDRIRAVKALYGWDITPEQLAWYRRKIDPSRELDDDDPEDSNLIQEQPWLEEEAFQQTGSSFFQSDKLAQASARIANGPKPQAFKFWPGIDFVTSDILLSKTRREIEFKMWEEPAMHSSYVIAVDPAFGHSEDNCNSCVQVLRCYADAIDQVGEYASATIMPHQLAWLLWTLVGYYGSRGSPVMVIGELNGPGEEVCRQFDSTQAIVQRGYLRSAAREKGISDIFNNARTYIYSRTDSFAAGSNKWFKTTLQNKIQIMEALRNYFHNGILTIYSMDAIEEMRTVTRDGDTIGAEGRNRDDRNFALALGVRAWDERVRKPLIAGNRTREAERAKLSLSMEDQWRLWNSNTLAGFFKTKEQGRREQQWAESRAAWRSGIGMRRPPVARRY